MVRRVSHRALEQMRNPSLKNMIGAQADCMEIARIFQRPVELGVANGASARKNRIR